MNISLIALDLDGTLLDKNGEIPQINREALAACRKKGIRILLNSGRAYEGMCTFAQKLGVEAILASCNGARIDEDMRASTLIERPFDQARADFAYELLEKSDLYYSVYTRSHTYMGNSEKRFLHPHFRSHVAGIFENAGHLYEVVDDPERLMMEGVQRPYKFVAMAEENAPELQALREKFLASNLGFNVSRSSAHNIEVMMPEVDKGFALRYIMRRYDIGAENVMAFGDYENDLPVLKTAGFPVAMENGSDELKAVAKCIAPAHHLGGVGQVLRQYVLGE